MVILCKGFLRVQLLDYVSVIATDGLYNVHFNVVSSCPHLVLHVCNCVGIFHVLIYQIQS